MQLGGKTSFLLHQNVSKFSLNQFNLKWLSGSTRGRGLRSGSAV